MPFFGGTAEAGETAAIDQVEVQIQRASDGRYLAGSEWVMDTTWLTATGTLTWFYTLPALYDSDYYLRARAWTTDGYSDTSPAMVVFTYFCVVQMPGAIEECINALRK